MTDFQELLYLWRENFSNQLNCSESATAGHSDTESVVDDDENGIPILNYDQVRKANTFKLY